MFFQVYLDRIKETLSEGSGEGVQRFMPAMETILQQALGRGRRQYGLEGEPESSCLPCLFMDSQDILSLRRVSRFILAHTQFRNMRFIGDLTYQKSLENLVRYLNQRSNDLATFEALDSGYDSTCDGQP